MGQHQISARRSRVIRPTTRGSRPAAGARLLPIGRTSSVALHVPPLNRGKPQLGRWAFYWE
eukprot:scaffold23856_cov106-Isochrysis_galbana.AAC.5